MIHTKTGTRTVDLVCISTDPSQRVTFLVEAKTSTASYSLPAKDERALRDYVTEIEQTLTTLPPLRFVLVVSNGATKTLEHKLRDLETKSGKPVRFMTATALGRLRASMPGPVPVGPFCNLLLDGPSILSEDFAGSITAIYRRQQDAHREFTEALMRAGDVLSLPDSGGERPRG